MRKMRTWACVTVAAVLAMLVGRRIGESVALDPDNLGAA
jgi:hypothetical protein